MPESATRQLSLFAEDRANLPLKDDRVLMEHPFFSLEKKPQMKPIFYQHDDVEIIVEPGPRGVATIWDKEVLIYIASILNERIERGEIPSHKIRFVAADFLKRTKRSTGKRGYELLLNALDRLRNTSIRTTIASGDEKERRGFGWIESWRTIDRTLPNGKTVMVAVEVTLSDWVFRAITRDRRVLTIHDEYFTMSKGLARRFYELARKHCGRQKSWSISLPRLKDKCGSNREIRRFKADVVSLIRENCLPEYTMEINVARDPARSRITFRPKKLINKTSASQRPKLKGSFELSVHTLIDAKESYPNYDIQHIEQEWRAWAQKKHKDAPLNPDKAFLAFCTRYVANHPI
ncbi:replication initiator protein A [Adonisia turfae]|uniref:Plasmid replication initiator n=1 Tax=Adonisia turfae CCMR0081 TaxID=2292702 RepID=A0A6M0RXW4_9CYAN|nr:replication initiator protein A [Adonisia turfae]NEZ61024.1 plasmid replication initiator [Adonisia turfae CCMR0081]